MKNRKLVMTILAVAFLLLLSLPMVILDGDATAFALILVLGFCAVYSEIYNIKKEKNRRSKK